MCNNTVDEETDLPMEEEEESIKDQTHVTFRIKTDQIIFFKMMANNFYENQHISEQN